jgi:hypothetical protein
MKQLLLTILIGSLLLPSSVIARDKNYRWQDLQSIASGQKVLVKTFSGESLNGVFGRATESALNMNSAGKDKEIPMAEISRVYLVQGRQTAKGILIGSLVGTAAGAGLGAIAGREGDSKWAFFSQGAVTAAGAGLGFVGGSITGLVIGVSKSKKVMIYKADKHD